MPRAPILNTTYKAHYMRVMSKRNAGNDGNRDENGACEMNDTEMSEQERDAEFDAWDAEERARVIGELITPMQNKRFAPTQSDHTYLTAMNRYHIRRELRDVTEHVLFDMTEALSKARSATGELTCDTLHAVVSELCDMVERETRFREGETAS